MKVTLANPSSHTSPWQTHQFLGLQTPGISYQDLKRVPQLSALVAIRTPASENTTCGWASLQAGSQMQESPARRLCVLATKSYRILCHPMDCSPPGSSVHGILQARIVEWVVTPFSRGIFPTQGLNQLFCIAGRFFTIWATREALRTLPWWLRW